MDTAKVFINGRSQAIRLPKEYRVEDSEVYLKKCGDIVLLIPKNSVWTTFISGLNSFTPDFMTERGQPEAQNSNEVL